MCYANDLFVWVRIAKTGSDGMKARVIDSTEEDLTESIDEPLETIGPSKRD